MRDPQMNLELPFSWEIKQTEAIYNLYVSVHELPCRNAYRKKPKTVGI